MTGRDDEQHGADAYSYVFADEYGPVDWEAEAEKIINDDVFEEQIRQYQERVREYQRRVEEEARRYNESIFNRVRDRMRRQASPRTKIESELAENLDRLIRLCHPDKHGGSESSKEITQWLLGLRKKL